MQQKPAKQIELSAAKRYLDTQIQTMKKQGAAPELSREAYDALVQKIATITAAAADSSKTARIGSRVADRR